jgi:hypothetical protein
MVQQWRRILIMICVEIVGMFATSDNIFGLMLKCLIDFGGLGL